MANVSNIHGDKLCNRIFLIIGILLCCSVYADNQTSTISTIEMEDCLPFRVRLNLADFSLPMGVQSYIHAIYQDKWLIITGRTGGLHGFVFDSTDNFPVQEQNTFVFVVDPKEKKTYIRSLLDPHSGLTQEQVDLLSVTAAQGYQSGKTLYITGGYGVDSSTGRLDTKDVLTAIDIPGLINWVTHPESNKTAAQYIRHVYDHIFKVTGGYMNKAGKHDPTLLILGHEFNGFYHDPNQQPPVFQQYINQVRRFHIIDDGVHLSFKAKTPLPLFPDSNYRRRDLNVVPVVKKGKYKTSNGFVALSGVFTVTGGIWTVPIEITNRGCSCMADPNLPSTFKQGMNNYDCATFGMYSKTTGDMYTILLGGMTLGFFEQTKCGCLAFKTDDRIPFTSQTTTIRLDADDNFTQYFMKSGGFPFIASTTVNPGNQLLFGSECEVFLLDCVPKYSNEVIQLDKIKSPKVIGYVVGGIASTLPNTDTQADSFPSQYIFEIVIEPVK